MPSITIIAALGITIRNTAFSITIKNCTQNSNKMQHIKNTILSINFTQYNDT
jgi:hypothetical protein